MLNVVQVIDGVQNIRSAHVVWLVFCGPARMRLVYGGWAD